MNELTGLKVGKCADLGNKTHCPSGKCELPILCLLGSVLCFHCLIFSSPDTDHPGETEAACYASEWF